MGAAVDRRNSLPARRERNSLNKVEAAVNQIVFLKIQFWILVASSLALPGWICWFLMTRRAISRKAVLLFGITLLLLSALDLLLLPVLHNEAQRSQTTMDDEVFASEYSIALYLLPLLSAGLGVNLISHVLRSHLQFAEMQFDREKKDKSPPE
jgi:hypothetical protein